MQNIFEQIGAIVSNIIGGKENPVQPRLQPHLRAPAVPRYIALKPLGPRIPAGCKRVRVRKNVNSLTSYEEQRLKNALKNAIGRRSPMDSPWANFQDIASFHGYGDGLTYGDPSSLLPCPTKASGCCPHSTHLASPDFLSWHRLYMV